MSDESQRGFLQQRFSDAGLLGEDRGLDLAGAMERMAAAHVSQAPSQRLTLLQMEDQHGKWLPHAMITNLDQLGSDLYRAGALYSVPYTIHAVMALQLYDAYWQPIGKPAVVDGWLDNHLTLGDRGPHRHGGGERGLHLLLPEQILSLEQDGGRCSQEIEYDDFDDECPPGNDPEGNPYAFGAASKEVCWSVDTAFDTSATCWDSDRNAQTTYYTLNFEVEAGGTPYQVSVKSSTNVTNCPVDSCCDADGSATCKIPVIYFVWGCLPEGTPVRMADGSLKPIEQIQVEEQVIAGADGRTLTVADTFWGQEEDPLVVIEDDSGRVLEATRTHPIVTARGVMLAKQVAVGDVLTTEDGSSTVVSVAEGATGAKVWNLALGVSGEAVAEDDTTLFANGILVGDNRMQGTYERRYVTGGDAVHDPLDADGAATSGSARILGLAGGEPYSLSQCLPASPGSGVTFGGAVRLDSPSPSGPLAFAQVEHFARSGCRGRAFAGAATGTVHPDPGAPWQPLPTAAASRPRAVSMLVSFVVDPAGAAGFDVYFDDLYVYLHLFTDGFESEDTTRWSQTVE